MKARYGMKLKVSSGGYVIGEERGSTLALRVGGRSTRIYERWRALLATDAAVADAYVEGVMDSIKFEMLGAD
jgi:hypothetical protein